MKKSTKVSHPNHYNWIPDIECEDVVKWFDFSKGNVIKYIWRSGKKNSESELDDLLKAHHYLVLAINMTTEHEGVKIDVNDLLVAREYLDEAIATVENRNKNKEIR